MKSFGRTHFPLEPDSGLPRSSRDTHSSMDLPVRHSTPSLNSWIGEKIKQIECIAANIKTTKEGFLKKYSEMNRRIDCTMQNIYLIAQAKKDDLDAQLQDIINAEVLSWDRQVKICEEARDRLKNTKFDFLDFENLHKICDVYTESIGFIHSPTLSFDTHSPAELSEFENIVKVSCPKIIQEHNVEKIKPKFCIGNKGQYAGEFTHPWGVCTDPRGRVLVADRGSNRIKIFNEHGKFLREFGQIGTCAGEFNRPTGITADKKCRIIVSDRNNHRIQVFTFSGQFLFMFGRKGTKPGQFHYPWDVDTNSEDDIAVSDTKNHRVQLFKRNGTFIAQINFKNYRRELNNQPVCPFGVAFKPDGTVLVTDTKNHNILKIDQKLLKVLKIQNYLEYFKPQGIACNEHGQVVVADGIHNKILIFDQQEKPIRIFGLQGIRLGLFENPLGICFHPNGNIILADFANNKIQVYSM